MTEERLYDRLGPLCIRCVGLSAGVVLMTRWMWRYLREPLVVIVAVLLFTPTLIDPAKDVYAAIAVSALDLMFKVGSNVGVPSPIGDGTA